MLFCGCAGFFCFFLGDWNDWKLHQKWLCWLFPAGAALLSAATMLSLHPTKAPAGMLWLRVPLLVLAAGFLLLEVYVLFFSFPADKAYRAPGEPRPVFTGGVYTLCRHPGVWCLLGLMGCLTLAAGLPVFHTILYTALNVLLVLFEDRLVFPSVLSGYGAYRRQTPFLIPTPASVKCWRTRKTREGA